jgi:hypothetical protein
MIRQREGDDHSTDSVDKRDGDKKLNLPIVDCATSVAVFVLVPKVFS